MAINIVSAEAAAALQVLDRARYAAIQIAPSWGIRRGPVVWREGTLEILEPYVAFKNNDYGKRALALTVGP